MVEEMKVIEVDVNDVIPYSNNPRRNEKAVDAVANSIKEFGFKNPIIVDKDMIVIAGHTRLEAAKRLGLKKVPVYISNLDKQKAKAFRLADNRVSDFSVWDNDKLKQELSEIEMDMTQFGFEEDHEALKKDLAQFQHKCPKCGHQWND